MRFNEIVANRKEVLLPLVAILKNENTNVQKLVTILDWGVDVTDFESVNDIAVVVVTTNAKIDKNLGGNASVLT